MAPPDLHAFLAGRMEECYINTQKYVIFEKKNPKKIW